MSSYIPAVDLHLLIAELRSGGGDATNVEVKAAAGGLPSSIDRSLSALSNLPGGGVIILGLDERMGFRPVPINLPALKQGLASTARRCSPPAVVDFTDEVADGHRVVVGRVRECAASAKPCRTGSGRAYLRGRGLARFDDTDMLLHGGVMHPSGHLTVAGLLTLGLHPQRWFPQYVVRAATEPHASDSDRVRARDVRVFDGPIPRILNDILRWAAGTFDTRMESTSDGHVLDVPEYPLEAFRELIANALVHRDLDAWSEGLAIEVRHRRDRLVESPSIGWGRTTSHPHETACLWHCART